MTEQEKKMVVLIRESDVIDRTDGSELAKAFNHIFDNYVEPAMSYGASDEDGKEITSEDQQQIILNYLENSYAGARAMDDPECMVRIARAIEAFNLPTDKDVIIQEKTSDYDDTFEFLKKGAESLAKENPGLFNKTNMH